MAKSQETKKWHASVIIVAIAIVLYFLASYVFLPHLKAWIMSRYPVAFAVQKTLETKYPQKHVEVADQTYFGAASQHSNGHVLIVRVVGNSYLKSNEKDDVKDTICSELGKYDQRYISVVLESVVEHRFLIFFSREGQPETFVCH